jgi:hypothetical protein
VIETVQIHIGKELTGQIANGNGTTPLQRRKEIRILREILHNRFLRIAMIQNRLDEPAHTIIGDFPAQHAIENVVIDAWKVFVDVALQHILVLAAKLCETINCPMRSFADPTGV